MGGKKHFIDGFGRTNVAGLSDLAGTLIVQAPAVHPCSLTRSDLCSHFLLSKNDPFCYLFWEKLGISSVLSKKMLPSFESDKLLCFIYILKMWVMFGSKRSEDVQNSWKWVRETNLSTLNAIFALLLVTFCTVFVL